MNRRNMYAYVSERCQKCGLLKQRIAASTRTCKCKEAEE